MTEQNSTFHEVVVGVVSNILHDILLVLAGMGIGYVRSKKFRKSYRRFINRSTLTLKNAAADGRQVMNPVVLALVFDMRRRQLQLSLAIASLIMIILAFIVHWSFMSTYTGPYVSRNEPTLFSLTMHRSAN